MLEIHPVGNPGVGNVGREGSQKRLSQAKGKKLMGAGTDRPQEPGTSGLSQAPGRGLKIPPDLPFPCLSFSTQSPVQGLVVY